MTAAEITINFECEGDQLVGVLHKPCGLPDTVVIVVVGGPQYRVGSHRQFVLLARDLAAAGLAVLRFDVRGMGDSGGDPRRFEALTVDIGAAIDAAHLALPCLKRTILWGLCDGASAILLYLDETADPRITALCLANPWIRSEVSRAKTYVRHYYLKRLQQPDFWRKLVTGSLKGSAIRGALGSLRSLAMAGRKRQSGSMPYPARMARGWRAFGGNTLLLLSERDYTAKEFEDHASTDEGWRGLFQQPSVQLCRLSGTDHTFSDVAGRLAVQAATRAFVAIRADRDVRALRPGEPD